MASTVTVDFNANLTRFSSAIDKATNDLNRFQSNTARIAGNLKSAVGILGVGFSLAGIVGAVREAANFADEMGKAAQKVGTTTEALSGLKYAGDLADVTFETLQLSMGKLAKNAEDFRDGSKSAVEAFGKIGIDPTKFTDTSQLLSAVADGLLKVENAGRRSAIAQEIFGKSGKELIPLLNAGSKGLKEAADEAQKFGVIVSSEAAAQAEIFNDNMTRLETAAQGVKISFGNQLIPALSAASIEMAEAAKNGGVLHGVLVGLREAWAYAFGLDSDTALREQYDKTIADLEKQRKFVENLRKSGGRFKDPFGIEWGANAEAMAKAEERLKSLERTASGLKDLLETPPPATPNLNPDGGAESPNPNAKNKKQSGKSQAQIAAEETAKLIQQFRDATAPSQTLSEKLQDQLDTYRALNPQVKEYLQSLVDQAKASEVAAKAQEDAAYWQEIMVDSIDREIDAFNEAEEAQKSFEQSIQDYVDSVERAADPTLELADNIGKLQSALSLGLIDQETFDRLSKFVEENEKKSDEITEFWKEAARNMQDAMSDFFFDAMQGKLGDLASSFKATIDRMVANLLASQLTDFLFGADFGKNGELGGAVGDIFSGSGIGDFFSGLFNANGNAFNQSGLIPFANGGIVSSAVPFSFGGSKLGVMGEAGPEAILPLRRGANGQLGVQMTGGAPIIMNITTPDANSFRKSQPQIMADMQRSLNRGRRVV
jgi:lambda family phage tail tape measure protein